MGFLIASVALASFSRDSTPTVEGTFGIAGCLLVGNSKFWLENTEGWHEERRNKKEEWILQKIITMLVLQYDFLVRLSKQEAPFVAYFIINFPTYQSSCQT